MRSRRKERALAEMVERLNKQLDFLEEHGRRAFEEQRDEYLPEVAGKLRILVVRSRQNTPLLFQVADSLNIKPTLILNGPPRRASSVGPGRGDEITLDSYFDMEAVSVRTGAGMVSLTKRNLIRAWAEQLGGVHEDWAVDESLLNALHTPIRLLGMEPSVMELRNSTKIVLHHGRRLVEAGRRGPTPA